MKIHYPIKTCLVGSLFTISSLTFGASFGSGFGDVKEVAAGGVGTGAAPSNLVYFTLDSPSIFSDCATSPSPHYVINLDEGGQTMVSLLLAAKLAGNKVHVAGKGTCNFIPGHEDVSLIYVD